MLQTQASRRRISAAVVLLGLTGGTAVVAIAARAPLSRSTPIDAASATVPASALFLVLAGGGFVLLAGLALLAPARRRRQDDLPEPEPTLPEVPWIVKLVVTLLPLALGAAIIVAVLNGTKRLRNAIPGSGLALGLGSGSGRAAPAPAGGTRTGFVLASWLPWTVLGIVAAAAIVAAVVLLVRSRQQPAPEPDESAAAGAALGAAIGALEADTDARRAVIAAYGAMQRTLAAHGFARSRSEAPRELLSRVLKAGRATEGEAATLTGLFEEARFSTHPIPERARGVALAALGSLQARLSAGEAG